MTSGNSADHWDETGKSGDKCGVFAAYDLTGQGRNTAPAIIRGLHKEQHRGHLSAGIATIDYTRRKILKRLTGNGLVNEVFRVDDAEAHQRIIDENAGEAGIGHVRYLTSGESDAEMAQPWGYKHGRPHKRFAFAFNGNIANYHELQRELNEKVGYHLDYDIDTEVLMYYLAFFSKDDKPVPLPHIFKRLQQTIDGSCNLVYLNGAGDMGIYRHNGLRPLVWGVTDDGILMAASETVALEEFLDESQMLDVIPGELITVDGKTRKIDRHQIHQPDAGMCELEYAYYASEASEIEAIPVQETRRNLGRKMGEMETEPITSEAIVVGIPDSGIPSAVGFSEVTKAPIRTGLVRSRYVGRTYIDLDPRAKAEQKFSIVPHDFHDKKVFLVDDSFIKGNTMPPVLKLLAERGKPKEIHIRITNPPVIYPCFYGMKHSDQSELMVAQFLKLMRDGGVTPEVEKALMDVLNVHANGLIKSIKFLPAEKTPEAIGVETRALCMACMTGEYPTPYGQAAKIKLDHDRS